eukprot:5609462-Pyramimonas_sp.AAC.1
MGRGSTSPPLRRLRQGGEQLAGAARPQPEPERKKGAMRCSACGAELEDTTSFCLRRPPASSSLL